tara:strand:- start:156 stop:1103 length:948 start_codon:yes stop_codon:yes gene_type:complete
MKLIKSIILISLFNIISTYSYGNEKIDAIVDQIQILTKDLKTLEKAVYNKSDVSNSSGLQSNDLNEDVLTRHLLKLNNIEDQFRELTNRFEEINFKMDKLSSRITKIQSDTQIRLSDLEDSGDQVKISKKIEKKNNLPGTDKPKDFLSGSGYQKTNEEESQKINSIETAASVVTSEPEKRESLLPNKPAKVQYDFALSFMKVGDYETAEFALKEFIDKNKDHDLAGNAQYWYGETFRIRQLYSDAATAYLDGYQNYPKSKKAPDNLLKLGITMVQLGEKDEGCNMIAGIKKQYPKASKSVLQKAQYEQKKFKCVK